MNPANDPILMHLPTWLLVFFRLLGLFVLAPVFSSVSLPTRIKVLWALALSFCVYPAIMGRPASANLIQPLMAQGFSLWAMPWAIAMELALGLVLGYGANLVLVGMQMAGHVVDQQIGLGIAGVFNPEMDEQTGAIGEFYFILAIMLFIILGGDRVMLHTLLNSFDHIPLGGLVIHHSTITLLTNLIASVLELAIRISAPLLCLIFLESLAIGFVARTVPQLNIMSVGFAIRIVAGVMILIVALNSQVEVYIQTMRLHLAWTWDALTNASIPSF